MGVDLGWKVAWGLCRTQVLGSTLPIAETCEGRSSEWPLRRFRAGEALAGMSRKKIQWPEVSRESE